jgi:1-deoxy-D-xylulose-5-phosphate synthase
LPAAHAANTSTTSFNEVFSESIVKVAAADDRIVALTAAMAGPTGLLEFEARYPDRFFDVGIAEQHAVTAAAGMAMGGLKPIVAMYSTFFSRAFDQANLDVGLLNLPVVFVFKSSGITGDDGPSHHGLLDIVLCLAIPNMTIFAPSTAEEIPVMLDTALSLSGPSAIRYPKTDSPSFDGRVGEGLSARRVTLYDVRVLPPDSEMIDDALRHERIITVEDATRHGGAGTLMVSAVRLRAQELGRPFPTTRILGVPRVYLEHHKPDELLAELGLDPEGLAGAFTRLLEGQPEYPPAYHEAPRPNYS